VTAEYIPSLVLVADLLARGDLELDGDGGVKLRGYAQVSIAGQYWDCEMVDRDITVEDCIGRVYEWGRNGIAEPPSMPPEEERRFLVACREELEIRARLDTLRNGETVGVAN
jgi:hypothetical protein